jgi:transposase-like protein
MQNPFRYFNSSPEVIRLAVMMYIRYPLSLRQVEDLLFERGIDICHETVRFWWNRFGPLFAAEIRKRRVHHRSYSQWRWQPPALAAHSRTHTEVSHRLAIAENPRVSAADRVFRRDNGMGS